MAPATERNPHDKRKKELYYSRLTEQAYEIRDLIKAVKIEILHGMKNNFDSEKYQKQVIEYLNYHLNNNIIEEFNFNFQQLITLRGNVLNKFSKETIAQTVEKTGLTPNYNLEVRAKIGKRGQIYKRKEPIDRYMEEFEINEIIQKSPELFLPKEVHGEKDVRIESTKNVIEFYKPTSSKPISLDTKNKTKPEYIQIYRIKSGPREGEKIVDWLLQTDREEFHYDGIGYHLIVSPKEFYECIKSIKNISDKDEYFKADFRPNEDKNYPKIITLNNHWDKSNMQKIISQGEAMIGFIEARRKNSLTDDDWKYIKKVLLAGVWIDHHYNNMRIESIVQTHQFHEWAEGPIGRDADADTEGNYDDKRMAKRETEHMNRKEGNIIAPAYGIATYLEERLEDSFKHRIEVNSYTNKKP